MATDFSEFTDALAAPEVANSVIEAALADDEEAPSESPSIPTIPNGLFTLPVGIVVEDKVYRDIEVRELTGEHEERLSKYRRSNDPAKWYSALLSCGLVKVGPHDAEQLLDQMIVGDRDFALLAIREATYGDEVEITDAFCPACGETFETTVTVSSIPITRLSSPADAQFSVPLRKGGKATVRLPNGADQMAYLEDPDLTDAERNSILLSRVVLSMTVDGNEMSLAGFPSLVRSLGVADRKAILAAIDERMPGPRYDEVTAEHEDCGNSVPVPLGLVSMFPGL